MKGAVQTVETGIALKVEHTDEIGGQDQASARFGIIIWTIVLLFLNWPLFFGRVPETFIFHPELTRSGDWWRWITHPWVHVSWYHLLLDGIAFLLLWGDLNAVKTRLKLFYILGGAAGSLVAAMGAAAPFVEAHGFCGLSGITHGLMAVWSLELIRSERPSSLLRTAGIVSFVSLLLKSGIEAATGAAAFSSLHFGLLGTPIVVCHAGGVIGAMVVYAIHVAAGGLERQNQA